MVNAVNYTKEMKKKTHGERESVKKSKKVSFSLNICAKVLIYIHMYIKRSMNLRNLKNSFFIFLNLLEKKHKIQKNNNKQFMNCFQCK